METQGFEFGEFFLDLKEKVLLRNGERVPINPKTFQLLVTLLENRGHLIEKDRLMTTLWPDSFVEEANLAFTVSLLRKALGDDAQSPVFIETVPRRGYRFTGEARHATATAEVPSPGNVETPPRSFLRHILVILSVAVLIGLFGFGFSWLKNEGGWPADSRRNLVKRAGKGNVTNMAITQDGSQIIFSQKEEVGESLWRLGTVPNDLIQLVPPMAVEYIGLSVSPKGDFVYFSTFGSNGAVPVLTRIPVSGGQIEPISDVTTDVSVTFSPDGREIAFTENKSSVNECYLKTAWADGSHQKTLLTTKGPDSDLPIFRASPVAWSPDGKSIAAALRESDGSGSFYRIILEDPVTGARSEIGDAHWNDVTHVAWLNATELVLIDSQPGSVQRDIWKLSTSTGERIKLTGESGAFDWLASAAGRIYSVKTNTHSGLFVGEFEDASKTLRSKQIYAESNLIQMVAWNKDGEIFFDSRESGKNEIWRIKPDGTIPQQVTYDSGLVDSFAISPANNSLIFSSFSDSRFSLVSTDLTGRNRKLLTAGTVDSNPAVSADGRHVLFQRGTMKTTLWELTTDKDEPPRPVTGYFAQTGKYSPDGSLISFHFIDFGESDPRWKLALIESSTHRVVKKLEFPIPIVNRETAWNSRNGTVAMACETAGGAAILVLDSRTGEHYVIPNVGSGKITSLGWSYDGLSLAFTQVHETSEVIEIDPSGVAQPSV